MYFSDLHEFLDPVYNKQAFSSLYRKSHLKQSGGRIPANVAAQVLGQSDKSTLQHGVGITVWETGQLIEVPRR